MGRSLAGLICRRDLIVAQKWNVRSFAGRDRVGALGVNITATAAVNGLPLTLAVVNPATSWVIQQWTENVANLAGGATYSLAPRTWKAVGKGGDSLLAVLSADVGGKYVKLARQTLSLTPSLAQRVGGNLALSSATPICFSLLTRKRGFLCRH